MYNTPVIVFGFNRKHHLRRVLESLMSNTVASQAEVFIYIDKPLDTDENNLRKNAEVIDMLSDLMPELEHAFKSVKLIVASKHLGCRDSIIGAIDEIIHQYGKAIMVEDDILTAPDFLQMMDDMLDFYQEDERVFGVGGYSEKLKALETYDKDVYALYRNSSWGWATWVDRFETVDFALSTDAIRDGETMRQLTRGGKELPGLLKNELLGLSDAWDVKFVYAMAKQKRIFILPTQSRTFNIGMDNSGTHCTSDTTQADNQQALKGAIPYKLEHVEVDSEIAKEFYRVHSYDLWGKLRRNFNAAGFKKALMRAGLWANRK